MTTLFHYISSLLKRSETDEVNETYWFPKLQTPGNERKDTPIQTRFLTELRELEQLEHLHSLKEIEVRHQFVFSFHWTESTLQPEAKQDVDGLLVEFHDILHGIVLTFELTQSSK